MLGFIIVLGYKHRVTVCIKFRNTMSEEDFIKQLDFVNNLKLRLGWGITGQQDINQGDYPYMATYLHTVGDQANYLRGYNNGVPVWVSLLRPKKDTI